MQSYTLYELNEYIRKVIALNFEEPIWINAEISQVNEVRGQVYLDLVDHHEESQSVIAQSNAIIWYKTLLFIKKKLGDLYPIILKDGSHVLLKVKVDFNERYGLKLVIEDIDASYTVGQLQMARQKLIERLKKDGHWQLNKNTHLPSVIQKVAVISSATAAGYQDFYQQINNNNQGYKLSVELFPAAMQGQNVEREVVSALLAIEEGNYDCVTIIRGGGSKLDLSFFDNYNIAATIGKMSIPVLVGIGHDIDESITDMVAYESLKTPTAVADYILEINMIFESQLIHLKKDVEQMAHFRLSNEKLQLEKMLQTLSYAPQRKLQAEQFNLEVYKNAIFDSGLTLLKEAHTHLNNLATTIDHAKPEKILKRGYAMVKNQKGFIMSSKALDKDDTITITYVDGDHKARIL